MSSRARRVETVRVEPFAWDALDGAAPAGPAAAHPAPQVSAQDAAHEQMRLAALERDAFAKGYAQGERAGGEAAATRADGMLRRLAQTIDELGALRAEILRKTERQMVQLVLAIAERVVHREVTIDRTLLVGMARAALDRLGEHGTATIRLHPDDYAAIGSVTPGEDAQVQVVADPLVRRGGCLVQSDFGFMDVSTDAQFRELARALLSDTEAPEDHAVAEHSVILK